MHWNVEYPGPDQILHANLNAASGWCLHESEPLRSMTLYVDGRPESDAILGYPRLDVSGAYPQARDRALRSGFRCEFDVSRLAPGPHLFEFHARTDTETAIFTRPVRKRDDRGPVLVTDVCIDIAGVCNLRCAMCPHGNLEGLKSSRETGFMPPRLFEQIAVYLQDSGFLGEQIDLYNWGEPLLHPELDDILRICRRLKVKAILSSNLSVPERRLQPLMNQPVDLLMVSISGFSQETYGRNHAGGNLRRVLDNLEILAAHRETIGTVLIKYLVFEHNRHEIALARRFAEAHGFQFGAYAGTIPSIESEACFSRNEAYAQETRAYVGPSATPRRATRSCPQETRIVVDHRGQLEHCSMAWNRPHARSVLEADIPAYLIDKLNNRRCQDCLGRGYSHYRHFDAYSPELLLLSSAARRPPAGDRAMRAVDPGG